KYSSELCITRKNGEVANCPGQIYKLHRGIMKFAPATYSNVVPNAQIMFTGLLDFFNTCFDDYGKLSKQSQQLLILNSFELMHRADDLYRSVHHFPDDDTLMPGYTTTFSLDNLDEFLADCPSGVNKEEAMAVIIKNTKRHLLVNKAHFKRLQLSIEEYLAFLGLALWKDHDSNVDDNMAEMVERNRSTIMTELHNHYAHKGKHNYAARLGDLLCLLVNMEELASQHTEDLKVYKLMNMFNEF
ncbi:hypothetical protein PENTCL1PPCAC_29650, partial [Pristionchus entomophagus]